MLLALGGAGVRCRTAIAPIVDGDARTAAATAACCADELDPLASTVMVVLSDGSGIDQDDVIRGAYDTVGAAIPLVGGGACGAHLQFDPTLFRQDENGIVAMSGVVVVATITSTGPIGIGVGHGFDPDGEPEVVTASGRNVVTTLGERPALDAYLRHHDAPADLFDIPEGFADFALARPLGVARRTRVEPRAVVGADEMARTLTMGATVPPGGLVWLMHGDSTRRSAPSTGGRRPPRRSATGRRSSSWRSIAPLAAPCSAGTGSSLRSTVWRGGRAARWRASTRTARSHARVGAPASTT